MHTMRVSYMSAVKIAAVIFNFFTRLLDIAGLVLHGEAAPKLFETWVTEYVEKVLHLAKLPLFPDDDMTLGKLVFFFVVWQGSCDFLYFELVSPTMLENVSLVDVQLL